MKSLKFFLISLVCVVLVTSAGFSMWSFVSIGDAPPQISSDSIMVDTMEFTAIDVEVIAPTQDGYLDYNISIKYGNENTHSDLSQDVCFSPSIRFLVREYQLLASNEQLYYYFTFTSTSTIYGANQSEDCYIYFDTTQNGHSEQSKVLINVRDQQDNLIVKTDDLGNPVLDEEDNPIYEIECSFTPVFKFKSGRKPNTISQYKQLLNLIQNSTGQSKLILHIISQ